MTPVATCRGGGGGGGGAGAASTQSTNFYSELRHTSSFPCSCKRPGRHAGSAWRCASRHDTPSKPAFFATCICLPHCLPFALHLIAPRPTWLSNICRPPSSRSGRRPQRSTSASPTNVPATLTLPAEQQVRGSRGLAGAQQEGQHWRELHPLPGGRGSQTAPLPACTVTPPLFAARNAPQERPRRLAETSSRPCPAVCHAPMMTAFSRAADVAEKESNMMGAAGGGRQARSSICVSTGLATGSTNFQLHAGGPEWHPPRL